ncbi:DNA polymerase Y family protein [Allokutzneria albata]|uniref:Protein ImuB n=1 Tax=Allokutzneria albata TaxID=211114 RepID=A0A1G9TU76_ALLAB|nr:DNA polymerase Y family protein [Allokutzneria albata]SDM51279.1 protein ImuB [Allokutzneria albata]
MRLIVVWCPDWPVIAAAATAGLPAHVPIAVIAANQVLACSATARAAGVRRGQRRRQAQQACPALEVVADDPDRDARVFEPVAAAVEELTPGVEVVRPGVVAVPARGPSRYFGGEEAVAELLVDRVAEAGVECQVGVADGLFAATLAARRGLIVPPGGSPAFLAPLGIDELDQPAERLPGRAELVDLVRRLGLRTLGEFAELPAADVLNRFGAAGALAHRLAAGLEERPPSRRRPPPDLTVDEEFDPPVTRVDAAAFAAKAIGERLHAELARRGLACVRLGIRARTEGGTELERVWRCAEPLTVEGVRDRVRWQLDGWLRVAGDGGLDGGIAELVLDPREVIGADALQLDLLSGEAETSAGERAGRALVRVQGLLGPESVWRGVLGGGRGPGERVRLVPWGDPPVPERPAERPWPGAVPAPTPERFATGPVPVTVLDENGAEVGVDERDELTATPHSVLAGQGPPRRILGWAGPWPAAPLVRLQVVLEPNSEVGERALLLAGDGSSWWVEGIYE